MAVHPAILGLGLDLGLVEICLARDKGLGMLHSRCSTETA